MRGGRNEKLLLNTILHVSQGRALIKKPTGNPEVGQSGLIEVCNWAGKHEGNSATIVIPRIVSTQWKVSWDDA